MTLTIGYDRLVIDPPNLDESPPGWGSWGFESSFDVKRLDISDYSQWAKAKDSHIYPFVIWMIVWRLLQVFCFCCHFWFFPGQMSISVTLESKWALCNSWGLENVQILFDNIEVHSTSLKWLAITKHWHETSKNIQKFLDDFQVGFIHCSYLFNLPIRFRPAFSTS